MLRRVTYDGQIAHGDKVYVGNHPAIIDRETFARAQAMLAEHVQGQRREPRSAEPSILAGKIVDTAGEPLTPAHATKTNARGGVTRYRYYVSRGLHQKTSTTGLRVPAREIEKLVATRLAELIDDPDRADRHRVARRAAPTGWSCCASAASSLASCAVSIGIRSPRLCKGSGLASEVSR
ncbi:hypothetical protein AB5I41_09660 [Sphingomonas sp. MMS24-JH45]